MRGFKEFVVEQNLGYADSLKLFGLTTPYSDEQLKSQYKKLAFQHHPDKGGSTAMMQKINAAYKILSDRADAEDIQTNYKDVAKESLRQNIINAKLVDAAFAAKFKPELFVKHFQEIFGDTFKFTVRRKTDPAKITKYESSFFYNCEFANSDDTTVIDLNMSLNLTDMLYKVFLGGPDSLTIPLYISTTIFHNRRKIKLSQQNYRFDRDNAVLSNPDLLFPKKKLEKKKDTEKSRKISIRDISLIFQNELGARFSGSGKQVWIYIPLPGDFQVVLYRTTLLRAGAWGVNGLYQKNKKIAQLGFAFVYENETAINAFVDGMKKIQKNADPTKYESMINQLMTSIKGLG